MSQFANAVYPVPDRFINLGKEPPGQPGTVATATYTFPLTSYKPEDKVTYLEDTAWRNAMAQLYNLVQGVQIADVSLGGPFFADGMGYPFLDIFGDYWQAVAGGVVGTSTSLSGSTLAGAGTIVVASSTGILANAIISVGGTGTTAEEVRKVTNVSGAGGTLTLNAALYQAHATGGTVFAYSSYAGIQHNFSLLNSGTGAGGWTSCQPATYTYIDFTGVPALTGARNYAYSCFSEVTVTSEATALINWDGKFTSLASQISASTPTTALTTVIPQAAWRSTVQIAGGATLNAAEWKLTLTRKVAPMFTNSGQADPFAIVRGYFTAALNFTFDPASDETEYLYYRNNTQPAVQLVATNGLAGTAAASLTVNAQAAGFDNSAIDDSKDVFGYTNTAKLVANTTNTGPSGGFSPCSVSLVNQVINY